MFPSKHRWGGGGKSGSPLDFFEKLHNKNAIKPKRGYPSAYLKTPRTQCTKFTKTFEYPPLPILNYCVNPCVGKSENENSLVTCCHDCHSRLLSILFRLHNIVTNFFRQNPFFLFLFFVLFLHFWAWDFSCWKAKLVMICRRTHSFKVAKVVGKIRLSCEKRIITIVSEMEMEKMEFWQTNRI